MTFADHLSNRSRLPIESLRRGRVGAAVRQTARAALAGAKQVGQGILVLGIFALMLVAAVAMGLRIWVPHFRVNW
jgi:hypothetical protein